MDLILGHILLWGVIWEERAHLGRGLPNASLGRSGLRMVNNKLTVSVR